MSLRTELETQGSWLFRHRSFLAVVGLPLLVAGLRSLTSVNQRHAWDEAWHVFCLLISLAGFAVRVVTIGYVPRGTSGRNTREQLAEKLNTTGIYSVVRHPLYLGNYVMVLGVALVFHTWWIVALTSCLFALCYERIMFAEESFLRSRFGLEFEEWSAVTPAVIPRMHLWRPPHLSFSWRNVLRREYTGLCVLTTVFTFLKVTGDFIAQGHIHIDLLWLIFALLGVAVYFTLRALKKHTHWLDEVGR